MHTRDDSASGIARLIGIMARLRDPERGCPWDRAQSFASIVPFTIEEAYEVADAIERRDFEDLRGELGDLLLQVVFYARMAEEERRFDFEDVAHAIADKLIRRHPHLFETASEEDATRVRRTWEAIKEVERREKAEASGAEASVLDGVARALPALSRAAKLQGRAARIGFDWPAATRMEAIFAKIEEEIGELRTVLETGEPLERAQDELGDVLFSLVNLARAIEVDAEAALRAGNAKFERRFRHLERALARSGREPAQVDLQTLEGYWREAKKEIG